MGGSGITEMQIPAVPISFQQFPHENKCYILTDELCVCVCVGKILETLQAPVDDQSYMKCINMGSGLRYVPSSMWFILN